MPSFLFKIEGKIMEAESSTRQDSDDQNIFSSPSHQEDKLKKQRINLELDDNLYAKL